MGAGKLPFSTEELVIIQMRDFELFQLVEWDHGQEKELAKCWGRLLFDRSLSPRQRVLPLAHMER